jgi:hypothetical protein
MGEMRNAYNILVGKPEGKRALGTPRRKWEYNTRMDVRVWTGFIWLRIKTNGGLL